jgi:hypothetical protein
MKSKNIFDIIFHLKYLYFNQKLLDFLFLIYKFMTLIRLFLSYNHFNFKFNLIKLFKLLKFFLVKIIIFDIFNQNIFLIDSFFLQIIIQCNLIYLFCLFQFNFQFENLITIFMINSLFIMSHLLNHHFLLKMSSI